MPRKKDENLEELFHNLDTILEQLKEDKSLEESFQMYHEGIDLLKRCSEKIDTIEKKVMVLDNNGEEHEF